MLQPEKSWLLGLRGGASVEYKPNLLELWVVGRYAKAAEKLSDDQLFKHTLECLHKFLDKKYKVSEPLAMIRSRWYSNPHFRGAFSYRGIDALKRKVYTEMLEKPLSPQNLASLPL